MDMIKNNHKALVITELSKRLRVFSQDQIADLKEQIREMIMNHQKVADRAQDESQD